LCLAPRLLKVAKGDRNGYLGGLYHHTAHTIRGPAVYPAPRLLKVAKGDRNGYLGGLYHHTAHTIRGAGRVSGSPLIKGSERKMK
jgi:hypothetical protein